MYDLKVYKLLSRVQRGFRTESIRKRQRGREGVMSTFKLQKDGGKKPIQYQVISM